MSEKVFEAPHITPEEYKKYRGKDVAIYKGKIVAAGRNSGEAFHNALKKYPKAKSEEIEIFYIQSTDEMMIL